MTTEPRIVPESLPERIHLATGLADAALASNDLDPGPCAQALAAIEDALAGARDGAERPELVVRRESLRQRLMVLAGVDEAREGVDAFVRAAVEEVETRADHLLADTSREPRQLARDLLAMADRTVWVESLLDVLQGERGLDPLEDVFAGLVSMRGELAELETDAGLASRAGEVYDRALAVRARQLQKRVAWLAAGDPSPEELWSTLRTIEDAWSEVSSRLAEGTSSLPRETLAGLEAVAGDVRARLLSWFASAPAEDAARVVEGFAADLRDRADEVLTQAEDVPLEAAVVQIDSTRLEIERLRAMTDAHVDWPNWRKRDRGALRDLCRVERRLVREGQERRLQRRMEGLLGRRFVAWLENLTLLLIVAVLGILVYEWRAGGSIPSLVWVDTAICAVFLADFGLRMALVDGRWLYFRRHALIDLLPSIPFGLLHLPGLDVVRTGRALRFLRLPQLVRYVRLARPAIRGFRAGAFLVRGLDRLVRKNARLLNRTVVAFDPPAAKAATVLADRLVVVIARCRGKGRRLLRSLPVEERRSILDREFVDLTHRVELAGERIESLGPRSPARTTSIARDVRLERVLDLLVQLDGAQVEAVLGHEQVGRIVRYLRLFQAPIVRNLPFTAPVARIVAEASDPYEATAEVGRLAGRVGQRVLGVFQWFSDLWGTVTAPQFFEMLGSAIVRATSRPAWRLIFFGGAFVLFDATAKVLGADWLTSTVTQPLESLIGLPLILLGSGCLVFLTLGIWFRRIAGEASDFYERTAEAHFLALMEDVKLARLPADLGTLYDRVLFAEEYVAGRASTRPRGTPEAVLRLYRKQRDAAAPPGWGEPRDDREVAKAPEVDWLLEDRVGSFLRDYLDGALLHRNDTKTTSQLIGNLAVQRIVSERLALGRRERKKLERLDLDRERGLFGGPYLWFRFITNAVAQRTAKLLIEYNRFAIPLESIASCDEAARARYEGWVGGPLEARVASRPPESAGAYQTTEFTALNFLSADPERDRAVEKRFGERVLGRLREDRRMLVRSLFGTYPLHRLPKERRTFNPFDAYHRHLAGGRLLVFPFRVAFWAFGLVVLGARGTVRVVRDLLDPEAALEQGGAEAGFEVAERKIFRMRRPVYLEAMRLRALFDVEYLRLRLPGEEVLPFEGHTCFEDLDRIHAIDRERDLFRALREDRQTALQRLGRHLEAAGLAGDGLARALDQIRPGLSSRRGEAHRALSIAYAIDYQGFRSYASAVPEAEEVWRAVLERPEILAAVPLRRRVLWRLASLWRRRIVLRPDPRRIEFERVLSRSALAGATRRERALLFRAVLANLRGVGDRVRRAGSAETEEEARRRGEAILRAVLARPHDWTEELVCLRTIQTLSVLDLRNYRTLVWELGRYAEDRPDAMPPT